jgi:hypothetical protein
LILVEILNLTKKFVTRVATTSLAPSTPSTIANIT